MAPKITQETAGCIIGKDYPSRIVEHSIASKANMAKMKRAYDASKNECVVTPARKKAKMNDYYKKK